MGRVIYVITFLLLTFINVSKANDSTLQLQLIKSIQGKYKNFEVDNLGNVYVITEGNQLKKLNSNFDSIALFNDTRRYGALTSIDVTNPLKLILFYKDFSSAVILDRFLNNVNTLDLRKQGIVQASLITTSYDNKIWCYDDVDNKLKKIDDNGNIIFESTDFRLLFNNSFTPEKVIDNNGKLYLYNKQLGLITFDYYGALKHQYPIKDLQDIQVSNETLTGFKDSSLINIKLLALKEENFKINIKKLAITKEIILGGKLFVLTENELSVYEIK